MGLDLYRYRIEKPDLDTSIVHSSKNLDRLNLEYRTVEENEQFHILPQEMIDNLCQKVRISHEKISDEKIFPFFASQYPDIYQGIDPKESDFSLQMITPDSYTFIDYTHTMGLVHPTVHISRSKSNDFQDITETVIQEAYVYRQTREAYQRKGLTSEGWNLLPENSIYCFNSDIVAQLTHHGLDDSFLRNWEDGVIAFYPNW